MYRTLAFILAIPLCVNFASAQNELSDEFIKIVCMPGCLFIIDQDAVKNEEGFFKEDLPPEVDSEFISAIEPIPRDRHGDALDNTLNTYPRGTRFFEIKTGWFTSEHFRSWKQFLEWAQATNQLEEAETRLSKSKLTDFLGSGR